MYTVTRAILRTALKVRRQRTHQAGSYAQLSSHTSTSKQCGAGIAPVWRGVREGLGTPTVLAQFASHIGALMKLVLALVRKIKGVITDVISYCTAQIVRRKRDMKATEEDGRDKSLGKSLEATPDPPFRVSSSLARGLSKNRSRLWATCTPDEVQKSGGPSAGSPDRYGQSHLPAHPAACENVNAKQCDDTFSQTK